LKCFVVCAYNAFRKNIIRNNKKYFSAKFAKKKEEIIDRINMINRMELRAILFT